MKPNVFFFCFSAARGEAFRAVQAQSAWPMKNKKKIVKAVGKL
jgi:hypothetical protein